MQTAQPSLFTRHDTILGACEGLGEDFGFNAQYLRVALAGLVFWNPMVAIGAYAAIALAVFVSRTLVPARPAAPAAETAAPAPIHAENDVQPAELAIAA